MNTPRLVPPVEPERFLHRGGAPLRRCPRCSLAELSEVAQTCPSCGYSPSLRGPVDQSGPSAVELAARRELAREFQIEALLGQEGGRIRYLARDRRNEPVVLTVIPRALLRDGAQQRFLRATEAARVLAHPHIIPHYGAGVGPSFLWYAAKPVDGRVLEDILRAGGPLELPACVRILEQVASALDHAHRLGVVHGGLGPGSVVIDANEWALVGDFGVAALEWSPRTDPTPASDQQALAALAYECLSGAQPWPGQVPPRLTELRPDIPAHAAEAVQRALSPFAADRYPSVLDFVTALALPAALPQGLWLGRVPQRGRGAGTRAPHVIIDFDPRPRRWMPRGALVLGLLLALGAGVVERLGRVAPPLAPPQPPPPAALVAPQGTATRPVPELRTDPGLLSVNAVPWGSVYVDERRVGDTPLMDLVLSPGPHRLRVERAGFHPYEADVRLAPGERLRITDIVLRAVAP